MVFNRNENFLNVVINLVNPSTRVDRLNDYIDRYVLDVCVLLNVDKYFYSFSLMYSIKID